MQTQKPSIPQPCHESWEQMQPNNDGRFCLSCQKTVTDFTQMSDEEIIQYLSTSRGKVCGRFKTHQIEQKTSILSGKEKLFLLYNNAQQIKSKPFRIIAMLALGLTLTLTGCKVRDQQKTDQPKDSTSCDENEGSHTVGNIAMPIDSTRKKDTVYINDKKTIDKQKIREHTSTHTVGEIAVPPPPEIMGKIIAPKVIIDTPDIQD